MSMFGFSMTAPRLLLGATLALGFYAGPVAAQSFPGCSSAANEQLLDWPPDSPTPVWQMCWLRPSHSSGPRGSGLEIRNVYYRGKQVFKRAHAPMLFAEYRGGTNATCYRDWKDENSAFLANPAVQNQLGIGENVITSCDRSTSPTLSFGICPFQLGSPGGASCFTGVAIQERGDRVTLTTQYVAGWYLYSMRWTFHLDGTIEPFFGLGNSNGTLNNTTHWHHNYWRFDFDISGANGDQLLLDGQLQPTEFSAVHQRGRVYGVRDSVTGRGYNVLPGDATSPPGAMDLVFPANESGRGFHTVDAMGTVFNNNEFGDNPNWSLSDCGVNVPALVTPTVPIDNADVVLYYRGGVRDSAGDFPPSAPVPADPMVCKSVGPRMLPAGDWSGSGDHVFRSRFEG